MRKNILKDKSYQFALRIIKLYKYLKSEKHEETIGKQILRSGTSIGANVEEALGAQSDKDFIAKLYISYKEARETDYWIRLLRDSKYLSLELAESIHKDCVELIKLSAAIILKMKEKQKH